MATNKGMFNFQQIMNDFYNYKPEEGDVAGQMQKQAYQGNMVQSALDAQLAQQLGQFNSALSQQNMTHQADLEQRNQSALMKEQFNYGMQNMDAQFQYQNSAANAQHDRDLGMLAAPVNSNVKTSSQGSAGSPRRDRSRRARPYEAEHDQRVF